MTLEDIKFDVKKLSDAEKELLKKGQSLREEAQTLYREEKYEDALDKEVEALRVLREAPDFSSIPFKHALAILLFDLAEIHFKLKDYKQSEKEVEVLFKVLEQLLKEDAEKFGEIHVLAMELSTRILRSRKKTLELLAKQQINTGVLYEKVNAGVAAATDKLVESLRKGAEMMAQTGDYRGAVRFYMEAIKLAKKRTGRVTRREVRMTIDMAKVMMHSRTESQRAKRLLAAVLQHAVALESLDLEQEILQIIEKIDSEANHESSWRTFMEKVQHTAKSTLRRVRKQAEDVKDDAKEAVDEAVEAVEEKAGKKDKK